MPISFVQAALGTEIQVPTLDGRVTLKVPAGTQNMRTFRMRGKGITHLRGGGQGDQFVQVVVEIPAKLSSRQREVDKNAQNTGA